MYAIQRVENSLIYVCLKFTVVHDEYFKPGACVLVEKCRAWRVATLHSSYISESQLFEFEEIHQDYFKRCKTTLRVSNYL